MHKELGLYSIGPEFDAGPMLYNFEKPHLFAQKRCPLLRPMLKPSGASLVGQELVLAEEIQVQARLERHATSESMEVKR